MLFEQTGQMPGADRSSDTVNSYLYVHEGVGNKYKMYASKYAQFVVNYAVEWHKVVSTRVGNGLTQAEKLRLEVDHYQAKVEGLRQTANQTMAKGKQVDSKSAEKLTRNEEKLIKFKESHSKFTSDLCLLLEEVTERSWRDLHPLIVKIAQFDVTLSGDEAKTIASLNAVVSELKKVAVTHGIKPQARLKDLDTLDPALLSTRTSESSTLAIENGFGGMALGGSSHSSGGVFGTMDSSEEMHFPPGSVAPQGLGGFPVQVLSGDMSNGYDLGRQSSFDGSASGKSSNAGGPPSTMDMMAISKSAAPAPTMDALAQAFGSAASGTRTSGGAPPYERGRNQSVDSFDSFISGHSGASGASAPPPAAPPPPPPPPTPSYGGSFGGAGGGGYNPFGSSPGPAPTVNPFGAASPSPYGAPPPQPLQGYGSAGGAPPQPINMYGSNPSPVGGALSPYGSIAAPSPTYGHYALQQQQQQPYHGQPPTPTSYGQQQQQQHPPPLPNSYGHQQQQPPYGQQPPTYRSQSSGNNPFG
jgi:hypothetical protein